jgi:hypothetical protein
MKVLVPHAVLPSPLLVTHCSYALCSMADSIVITTKVLILTCFMTFPRLLIFAYHWPPEIAGPMVPPEFRELFVIDRDSRPRMSMCKARAYPLIELQIIICGNPNRLRYSK